MKILELNNEEIIQSHSQSLVEIIEKTLLENESKNLAEESCKEAGYELRYEKGSFNSGYCILQDKQVIVINKYFTPEVRFNKILDLIPQILSNFKPIKTEASKKMLQKIIELHQYVNTIPFDEYK
jgi:hypothetical protein